MNIKNFKAVEFMRKRREELSRLYYRNKSEFVNIINEKEIKTKKTYKTANMHHKHK